MASTPKKNSNGNASLCACGSMRQRMTAGPQASFPGRDFFRCDSCGVFEWADAAPSRLFSGRAGPLCKCNKATVERTVKKEGPTKGRYFWSCAKWPHGCGFFHFKNVTTTVTEPILLLLGLDLHQRHKNVLLSQVLRLIYLIGIHFKTFKT